MSSVAIQGNASGAGVFTIASPNSASSYTATLPAGTGTFNISGVVNEVPAGTVSAPSIYSTGDTNTGIFFPAADTIAFSGGGVESMRIDSSGRLLIGVSTNTNGAALAVSSQIAKTTALLPIISLSATATVASIVSVGSSTAARTHIVFENGATVGSISTSGSATTYSTSSDYRLKENVAPMTGALEKIAALKPCTYKWKVDGTAGQGFIAHELQEVVPDCVGGEKDALDANGNPQYQGVDTSFLVATLTAAIQEQQALITSLTARIAALEGAQP